MLDSAKPQAPHQGFTLLELLLVISILAIISLLVLSNGSQDKELKLDRAASEVKAALDIVRSEAMRTGESHGVTANTSSQTISGYKLNTINVAFREYIVRHPQDKSLLNLQFGVSPLLREISLSNVSITFTTNPFTSEHLGFTSQGEPNFDDGINSAQLSSASITISHLGQSRTVSVNPNTGRTVITP
jgi:prepilin-type N-terminal cleavage/methylation domain-containing protein